MIASQELNLTYSASNKCWKNNASTVSFSISEIFRAGRGKAFLHSASENCMLGKRQNKHFETLLSRTDWTIEIIQRK